MASVEPRPKKKPTAWRVRWRFEDEWQSVTVVKGVKEANRIADLIKAHGHKLTRDQVIAMLNPTRATAGETVAELCRRHVESLTIEDGTRREYERSIRLHVAPTPLGRADIAEATREHVRLWVRGEEASGAAPKSISNHHSLLFAAFSDAIDEGKITLHPCRGVRLPRRDARVDADDEACFLTAQEVGMIADKLGRHRDVAWLLARTGLRWSEMTALQVRDVDLLATPPTLTVRRAWKRAEPKGWKLGPPKTPMSRRTISLDAATVEILLPRVAGRAESDFVITTWDGVRPLPHSTFRKAWERALYAPTTKTSPGGLVTQGLLDNRPRVHDLRHTHASWLLADPRVPMIAVQRRLGHESLLTTEKVYGHLRRGKDEAILAALDRLMIDGALGAVGQDAPGVGRQHAPDVEQSQ